jgi:hypothetical protein
MASATNTLHAGGHGPERNTKQGMTLLDITEISVGATTTLTLAAALVAASGVINEKTKQVTLIPTSGNFYWGVGDSGDPTIAFPNTVLAGASFGCKARTALYLRLLSTSGTCVIQVLQEG